jgi:hypothetical protein
VLQGLGWLSMNQVEAWRQGRVECLEKAVQTPPFKISAAMDAFRAWATRKGLEPGESEYVSRTRDRRPLRFSAGEDPEIEKRFRTHYVSPHLPAAKRARLEKKLQKAPDLVVVSPLNEWACGLCGRGEGFLIMEDNRPLCLECADLDHLAFLPAGNTALTRRSRALSRLSAVVVRFNRSRKRYERRGVLVEPEAVEKAEAECLADEEIRERRREREAVRREAEDRDLVQRMTEAIIALFPSCPPEEAASIARHTAVRGSGRVGRSAAGRALEPEAVTLAVNARIRHSKTRYDEYLMAGMDRSEAREFVASEVRNVLDAWRRPR